MGTVNTDDKGIYTFSVECGKTYNVRAEKEDYTTKKESVTIADENGKTNFDIALEKYNVRLLGDDLGKCFGIKMIYFDFDKYPTRSSFRS
jgi:hypothetical protein